MDSLGRTIPFDRNHRAPTPGENQLQAGRIDAEFDSCARGRRIETQGGGGGAAGAESGTSATDRNPGAAGAGADHGIGKGERGIATPFLKTSSAHEEERKRVAGELHDTIGSCLSAVMFKVTDVLRQTEQNPHASAEPLRTIIPVVQESIDECRRIQMDLRPSMLDDIGILATLSWFCRRYQTIYSEIRIEQEIEIKEGDVPPPLKIVVFRVIQETVNNIAKHSHANLVRLSLRKLNDRLDLMLQDNGQGFNLEKAHSQESKRRGLGLSSMKERVELSRGSFAIESTEGKGTIIRASWPLSALFGDLSDQGALLPYVPIP